MEALANLAHELRSPVQALLGYLDMLREELGETVSARHQQMLERMNVNAHDLAQTVENVMDFSVADAKAEAVDIEKINLLDLLIEVAPVLDAANAGKGLAVNFDVSGAPLVINSRRRPIKSIILNLAVNAIKFTDAGCVTIAVRSTEAPDFHPAIEITVTDTGPGIDAAMVARAFKLCAQLSHSSIRSHRGMGLGLAVVQRNALALGATIRVDSQLERGSAFIVTIPIDVYSAPFRADA